MTPHTPDDPLDRALAVALEAPRVPEGFRAALHAAIERQAALDFAARRAALDREHSQQLHALGAGFVRLRRDTLAAALGAAFTAGAAASATLPWLRSVTGIELSLLAPAIALLIGLCVGAAVWVDRFGAPPALR